MDGEGGGGVGPPGIPITAGGVEVVMLPVGWLDFIGIPDELNRVFAMPSDTGEEARAVVAAARELAARIDSYAAPGSPSLPSRIPARDMRAFIAEWIRGVRDAAVPPPSGAASRSGRRASARSRSR